MSEDGASIECIDDGAYSFNWEPCCISEGIISIRYTSVHFECGVMR